MAVTTTSSSSWLKVDLYGVTNSHLVGLSVLQGAAEYQVLSSEAKVPLLDLAVYRESSIPGTPPKSQSRQGWSYLILSWGTRGGKCFWPSPCIIGPQEGKSPFLDTCKGFQIGPNDYKLIQSCLNLKILSGHFEFVTYYLGLVMKWNWLYIISSSSNLSCY